MMKMEGDIITQTIPFLREDGDNVSHDGKGY